jgi:hypothetical protein
MVHRLGRAGISGTFMEPVPEAACVLTVKRASQKFFHAPWTARQHPWLPET